MFLRFISTLVFVLSLSFLSASAERKCAVFFDSNYLSFNVGEGEFLYVEYAQGGEKSSQMITGENFFPTRVILEGLDVNTSNANAIKGNVLLTGMSYTGVLPWLLSHKVYVKAMDISYQQKQLPVHPSSQHMRDFTAEFANHIVQGNALEMPFAKESYENIWSYRLVSGTDVSFQAKYIEEVIRVLKPGGEAKIYGFEKDEIDAIEEHVNKWVAQGGVEINFTQRESVWLWDSSIVPSYKQPTDVNSNIPEYGREMTMNDYLMILKKL